MKITSREELFWQIRKDWRAHQDDQTESFIGTYLRENKEKAAERIAMDKELLLGYLSGKASSKRRADSYTLLRALGLAYQMEVISAKEYVEGFCALRGSAKCRKFLEKIETRISQGEQIDYAAEKDRLCDEVKRAQETSFNDLVRDYFSNHGIRTRKKSDHAADGSYVEDIQPDIYKEAGEGYTDDIRVLNAYLQFAGETGESAAVKSVLEDTEYRRICQMLCVRLNEVSRPEDVADVRQVLIPLGFESECGIGLYLIGAAYRDAEEEEDMADGALSKTESNCYFGVISFEDMDLENEDSFSEEDLMEEEGNRLHYTMKLVCFKTLATALNYMQRQKAECFEKYDCFNYFAKQALENMLKLRHEAGLPQVLIPFFDHTATGPAAPLNRAEQAYNVKYAQREDEEVRKFMDETKKQRKA